MRKLIIAAAAAALALPAVSTPALAQSGGYEDPDDKDRGYDADQDFDDEDSVKFEDESAVEAGPVDPTDEAGTYEGETWRDDEGRLRCRRSDGTVGLVVGGAAGALVGRGIDTRGERGTGTILGATLGALLGRTVERNADVRCR